MLSSFGNLLKIKQYLDPSSRFSWGINRDDSWIYFGEKDFEAIFYLGKNGRINSICFWNTESGPAKYADQNNVDNVSVLLDSKNLNFKLKEWIIFNLDLICSVENK